MKITPKMQTRYPMALERENAKKYAAYIDEMARVIKSYLPEMEKLIISEGIHIDAADNQSRLDVLIDRIRRAIEKIPGLGSHIRKMADRIDKFAFAAFAAQIKSVFGQPFRRTAATGKEALAQKALSIIAGGEKKQPAKEDKPLSKLKEIWVNDNLSLIKSINDETMKKIRQTLMDKIINTYDKKLLTKGLAEDIEKIAGVEKSRAILIASDQVGKLNGRMVQYRQMAAGIEEYIWRSSNDERVRPLHRSPSRDGNKYRWDDPPEGGHPGEPIRCRCTASAVIDPDKTGIEPKKGTYIKAE